MSTESLIRDIRAVLDAHESGDGVTAGQRSGWRADGFSDAVSPNGGRRHIGVDDAFNVLRENGDQFSLKVAADSFEWFAFDLVEFPELDPGTDELREKNREARTNARGPVFLGSFPSHAFPFRLDLKPGTRNPFSGIHFDSINGQAWVHIQDGDTPSAFCERYAERMLERAAELRAAAEERDNGIIRPPTD